MYPRLAVIEIVVSDMAASLAFYRRLGMELPDGADDQPHVEADLGGVRIAWDTVEVIGSFDSGWSSPSGGHRVALAFECANADEVNRIFAELVETGYRSKIEPWDALWGMRYAVIYDPDGGTVDLFASLPEA